MGLTRSAIAVLALHLLGAAGVRADCGSYEDAERTTYRKLSWADFRGARPPDFQERVKRVVQSAHIATTLRVEPPRLDVLRDGAGRWVARPRDPCVRAFMLKERSGYKVELRTLRGLAHEQGHFDITEYFARELGHQLAGLEYRAPSPERARQGLWKVIEREYARTVARWKQMQARYDRETRHNQRALIQTRWLEKIKVLLAAPAPPDADRPRIARGDPDPHTRAGARHRP